MDFSFQHDYEYDWCANALRIARADMEKMRGTRWLVSLWRTDPLMVALLRFLQYADGLLGLGLSLTALVDTAEYEAASAALPSVKLLRSERQKERVDADYCVCSGYHAVESLEGATAYRHALEKMERFWQLAVPVRRAVVIGDGYAYAPYPVPVAAAEGEFQADGGAAQRFAREAERMAKSAGCWTVLRPGEVLAAGERVETPVARLLDALDAGEPLAADGTQFPVLYITDLLTAMMRIVVCGAGQGTYNICNSQVQATAAHICAMYAEAAGDLPETSLRIRSGAENGNRALSASKAEALGWRPAVSLETMLAMEAEARRGQTGGQRYARCHQGKLRAVQQLLVQMLCEVDSLCKKHDIPYFLGGGTLLGAVRHGGFIPWDDDLDIMMRREDYDRFIQIARAELPDGLFLQTPQTEPDCHYVISKVRMDGTTFSSEFLQRFPQLHKGIFLDVIAQDATADSRIGQKLHVKLTLLARGLLFKKWSGEAAAGVKWYYAVFDPIIRLLPFGLLEKFQQRVFTLFRGKRKRFLYDGMGANVGKGAYPAEWLASAVDVPFEGHAFPAPQAYDAYLRYLYGDYMRAVPASLRTNTHDVPVIDLGDHADAAF